MDEKKVKAPNEKNPALAAVISAVFPGVGLFYIGNFLKGIAYIMIFAILVSLEVHTSSYYSRVMEIIFFGILIVGFYIFQIVDSYNEAKDYNYRLMGANGGERVRQQLSLFASIFILALGIIFQLERLDILDYRDILDYWPLLLIAIGANFIFAYARSKEGEADE